MSTFPFFAISREFDVPYGMVIRMVDSIEHHRRPEEDDPALVHEVEIAMWRERRRRAMNGSIMDGHR